MSHVVSHFSLSHDQRPVVAPSIWFCDSQIVHCRILSDESKNSLVNLMDVSIVAVDDLILSSQYSAKTTANTCNVTADEKYHPTVSHNSLPIEDPSSAAPLASWCQAIGQRQRVVSRKSRRLDLSRHAARVMNDLNGVVDHQ